MAEHMVSSILYTAYSTHGRLAPSLYISSTAVNLSEISLGQVCTHG